MIRVPSISSIYDSTGIPILRVSLTHFASSLSILLNVPVRGLTFLRTFFVQTADLYIFSLDIIVLNDFLSKVGRLNTFMTHLQVSDTPPTSLNFSMICNFSATVKRLVICFSACCDAGSFLRTFFAGDLSLSLCCWGKEGCWRTSLSGRGRFSYSSLANGISPARSCMCKWTARPWGALNFRLQYLQTGCKPTASTNLGPVSRNMLLMFCCKRGFLALPTATPFLRFMTIKIVSFKSCLRAQTLVFNKSHEIPKQITAIINGWGLLNQRRENVQFYHGIILM